MSMDNKVPEIRFKGFSEEWEDKELGELAEIVRGASPRPIEDPKWFDSQSSVGWLRIRDVTEQDGRIHYLEQKISKLGQEKTRVLHEKHLLLSIAASVGKPVVNYVETGVHDGFLIFRKPLFELEFMYQWLKSFEAKWQQFGQPGSQVNLNSDIVKNQCVTIPANEEQATIGNYFQKLDTLINQHQQKHDKLSNIKTAMLEKMFPKPGETMPEIRFKGFGGEWEENDLSNEVEFFSGLTYSPSDIRKSGTLVLRSSNVKNGQLIEADDVYVNPEVVNCSNVIEGDVIVVVRNGSRSLIGKHAQVTSRMDNTVIGAFMTGIRSKQPAFINALLDTNTFTTEVERNLGATINQITNGSFKSMIFMFPTEDEQQEIGNVFQKLDALINQHQQQITKLNNIKQACLSKMFA